ncbi:hypothetical protein LQZ18_03665 [Lachnospiraceae bacterium ZAX-1]
MEKVKCHICEHVNESENQRPTFCIRCGADLANPEVETKIMEHTNARTGTYATSDKFSDIRKEAFIYLTNRRVIVIPATVDFYGLNLAGALTAVGAKMLYSKLTSGQSSLISIPLENIKVVRDGKFGLLVKALIIETNDGEIVKMTVSKQNEWKDAITKATNSLR